MKKLFLGIYILLGLLICLWTVKCTAELLAENRPAVQTEFLPEQTVPAAELPSESVTAVPETTTAAESPTVPDPSIPAEAVTEPTISTEAMTAPTVPTETTPVYTFTAEEEQLLLKLAAAERGSTGCTTCMALVMRTVLNRVEGPKFSSTIKGVIYAQDQFAPAMDGSLETAQPDWLCEKALKLVKEGWDESQGALYYEWCDGPSWHSQNLNLLLQHCDTRFYN